MDSAEFAEWMAFYLLEPFGDEWRQAAVVAMQVANQYRKPAHAAKMDDFLPVRVSARRETPEQMQTKFETFVRMHNQGRK